MARKVTYNVHYRRKREGKTDFRKRLDLLKSGEIRLVVRPSNKHMLAQLVEYSESGDKVLACANSKELSEFGWAYVTSNIPAAYLTGLLCGVRGKGKKVASAILDNGLQTSVKGSRVFASLKGCIDSGIKVPVEDKILPDESRISGQHIAAYAQKSKNITSDFIKTKDKILKSK